MRAVWSKVAWVVSRVGGSFKGAWRGLVVAALAFACGAALQSALGRARRSVPAAAPRVEVPPCPAEAPPVVAQPEPACYDEEDWGTPELEDWKNRHSGAPLPLDYEPGAEVAELSEAKVVVLPSGATLASAGDTLHMLDAARRVVWKYEVPQWLNDFAYVPRTGLVYVTAGDNNMFILDASTGRPVFTNSRNGSAGYGAVLPYGEDSCLVMDSFGGYRSDYRGGYEPTQDGVTAWRGTRMLWHRKVPPDAELRVVGSRIYAVTKTKSRVLVREIKPPKGVR